MTVGIKISITRKTLKILLDYLQYRGNFLLSKRSQVQVAGQVKRPEAALSPHSRPHPGDSSTAVLRFCEDQLPFVKTHL